jgi:DHA1 family multidrug resistance protein-like MFS transporter
MKPATNSRRNLYILAFSLVVVMLGYGIVIPVIPFYVEGMGAGGAELGLLIASYAFMRLIFGPLWGSLSDRIGRKPVLMIGVVGFAVAMFFFGLATELWMVFAARILSGLLSSATAPTTMAYIGDSTSEEERGRGMGVLGAAVGLGTVLGPGLGGLLSGDSLATPFFVAAGLSLLAVLLIYLLLPESLPAEARRTATSGGLGEQVRLVRKALLSPIGALLLLAFVITFGITTFYGIFALYVLERFGYGAKEVGAILMGMGLVSAVGQGLLSGPATKRWGEARVIRVAVLGGAVAYLLMLPATSAVALLLAIGFFILATALLIPALLALTSRLATLEQGITMGLSNSAMSLGRIAGPLLGGFVFDLNIIYPFLAGAAVMFAGFVITLTGLQQERGGAPNAELRPAEK